MMSGQRIAVKPSWYNILIRLTEGRCLAHNGTSGALGVWSRDEGLAYERALLDGEADLGDPNVIELARGGFLVPEATDELVLLERQYNAYRYDTRQLVLTLAPTLACNFGCDYCFQGQHKPGGAMTPAVQDAVVDLVARATATPVEAGGARAVGVAWYGGEPLLRLDIVESLSDRLIALCGERGARYEASMVSNGWFLGADTARRLYEHAVQSVQVTLDGDAHAHDQRRALLSGRPTFARIADNLRACLDASPIQLSIRVNVDRRNQDGIRGLLEHLAERGLAGHKRLTVYFAPVESTTGGCHAITAHCLPKGDYGALEAELCRYAFELGLGPLPYPGRFNGICGAVRPSGYVVLPDGDVHKCWDTVSLRGARVGSVQDPDPLGERALHERWMRWTPFAQEACRSCKLLPTCAGSCAYKVIYAEETRGVATLPCPSWKYNIKERLVLRAVGQGLIHRGDVDPRDRRTDPAELCADPSPHSQANTRSDDHTVVQ